MSDQYTNRLSAYLDAELDAGARARMEAHLAGCSECAALLADLRAIVTAAPVYAGRPPSRDLWNEIEARLGDGDAISIGAVPRAPIPSLRV